MPDFLDENRYQVEFHATAAALPDELWATEFRPPLEGRWWFDALEGAGLEDQFSFHYGLVTERGVNGRAVGIVPAFVMDVPIAEMAPAEFGGLLRVVGRVAPALLRQRTLFVGSPGLETGNVYLLPDLPEADRRSTLLAAQRALERHARQLGASLLIWKDLPTEPWTDDFAALAPLARLFRVPSLPGTVAPLPANGRKDDFFAALKSSRRHNLKKKLRRSRELVALDAAVVTTPDAGTLDKIFALFWQTYERSATKFERLNRRFFDLVAAPPAPTFFLTLREPTDGAMVAFMLCYGLGDRLINKFVGLDYARPKEWLLYFRLWEAVLDVALARGFTGIASGQLAYPFKVETGHELVPLFNYCQHRNPLMHAVYRRMARTVTPASLDAGLASFLKAHPEG